MKPSSLISLGMVAALMILTGCSEGDSSSVGKALPAPSRSTDAARAPESSPEEDDGIVTPQEAEKSEFAALDTNSNGTIEEAEWQSVEAEDLANLKNMNFAQIDRNSSGRIEPEEFRKARTGGDEQETADTGMDTAVRDSGADDPDPTGP